MPAIPFLYSHGIGIEFLVEVVKKSDGLNNHGINLFGRKFQFVSANRVSKTEGHGGKISVGKTRKKVGKVLTNSTEKIQRVGVGNNIELETRELVDSVTKLRISDNEVVLLVILKLFKQIGKLFRNLTFNNRVDFFEGRGGGVELGESLDFESVNENKR